MTPIWVRKTILPLLAVAGLSACAESGVQPGIVHTAAAAGPAYGAPAGPAETGRIVSIRDIEMRGGSVSGGGGRGVGNGMLVGGVVGGLGGAFLGSSIGGRGGGGGLVGLLLGAVGGAVAGAIVDRQGGGIGGGGRGIELIVQKDDGQSVTIAQRDDGDVQLGDRVQVVTDRNGVAKAVRDNSRPLD